MRIRAGIGLLAAAAGLAVWGQPSKLTPQFKAIWEPVNVKADIKLLDVAFANEQTGWVAGGKTEIKGGIILYTKDGGNSWTSQFGDAESSDRAVTGLRVLNATTAFATQSAGGGPDRLLHTSDGQNWDQAGTIAQHYKDYAFTSPTHGIHLDARRIYLTNDTGATWKPVGECRVDAQVDGLTRQLDCELEAIHFPTAEIGYAVASAHGVNQMFVLFRTSDGGATWQVTAVPASERGRDIFFTTPKTGFVRVGEADTGRLYRTDDGGDTWKGVGASPGFHIRFTDQAVGWSFHYGKLSFTTDGGTRWTSRTFRFPATVEAFSLASRKRGYVAGEHGMVYRYWIVPAAYTAPGMIDAPMM
ncbi:MAG TPA: YCF48-related protein [Bryobacteraceae bacterium]